MIDAQIQDKGLNCTINTTEDCNLRCKYCYEINKRPNSIDLDYCKKFIDVLFDDPDPININKYEKGTGIYDREWYKEGIVLDFIGGDALMDVDTLDKVCTYFTFKLWTTDPKKNPNVSYWRDHHRFSLSSNGTLFSDPKVRAFCEKWAGTLYVGVSIDGCPEIHDKNRIMLARGKNGEELGSMKYILESWDWYKKIFPTGATSTKATCSKETIPYIYDSLKFMHEELGLKEVMQNFIMEDTGATEDDYKLLDEQLRKCVPYVLEHRHDLHWQMFDYHQFAKHKLSTGVDWTEKGHCGSGAMPCLGINGNIYPCFRWAPHTQKLDNPEPIVVGNVHDGLNYKEGFNDVREGAYRSNCTKETKCRSCIYESACSYCIGGCYAEFQDFTRTTYICEFTKLQSKWAKVYWNEFNKLEGKPMEFDELFQLDRVPNWTKPISTTDELDI